ncbi:DNA-binding transcriptional repressor RpiR [Serratia odorifera]|uniref:DNA-binding transcriptional repressor RpiR n=1 Tax=Serratia odorifera TaxID=618 RepID=A0A3S4FU90_SEROD|nr:hypothetical protein [Serratia odorifera]VDZ63274.1 DNA-binding transcriptional repressor RpiR [Serratia odorifera]
MKQDPKAIGAQIRMRLPQLTPLERKVVDAITSKADLSEQTSLKEIAQENKVSDAMVVKLAKKTQLLRLSRFQKQPGFFIIILKWRVCMQK